MPIILISLSKTFYACVLVAGIVILLSYIPFKYNQFMGCATSNQATNRSTDGEKTMSAIQLGKTYVQRATGAHSATLIFLHGLGDDGSGWADEFKALKLDHVKIICPTAPTMAVTLNFGMQMNSWFDIRGLDPSAPEDEAGIVKASDALKSLVDAEIKAGVAPERIVVGGFSQGGATALYAALTTEKPLAGVVALSSWLPLNAKFPGILKGCRSSPIFQGHGTEDSLIHIEWGRKTGELLKSMNLKVDYHEYSGMGHSSSSQEIRDLKAFLASVVPP